MSLKALAMERFNFNNVYRKHLTPVTAFSKESIVKDDQVIKLHWPRNQLVKVQKISNSTYLLPGWTIITMTHSEWNILLTIYMPWKTGMLSYLALRQQLAMFEKQS